MNRSTDLSRLIAAGTPLLTEASVYELLRRDERIRFDPQIAHAGLIYDERSRGALAAVHRKYIDIANRSTLPLIAFADTWRASGERIAASAFRGRRVNHDNVDFMRGIAAESGGEVFVGALTGPRGDAYSPRESPAEAEALRYHAMQIEELAASGVDVMVAATFPALPEAKAIAELMSRCGRPWMLSFVVRPEGVLLDGTSLGDAISEIDDVTPAPPLGYSINCVHPEIARRALSTIRQELRERVIAFQGNTSMLAPEEVDGLAQIDPMDPQSFAEATALLRDSTHIRVIGGCCGTNEHHLEALANLLSG